MRALIFALAVSVLGVSSAGAADRYKVNLTRKDRNLYKADGTAIWVQTRYCYVYAYGQEAALSSSEVAFFDDGGKCDVRRVLKEVELSPGSYKTSLTHEDDNLYSTPSGELVRTSMCLNLALGDDAVLRMNGYGGTVIFLNDGDKCDVEAIFSQIRI